MALIFTTLPHLSLLSKGKVRDVYKTSDPSTLLFVATDRISAFDVILKNGIPDKGKILTDISLFWFKRLKNIIPNHFITTDVNQMPPEIGKYKDLLLGRTMLVKKVEVVPIEAIVRGYITGSAWAEYKRSGTICGIPLPEGLEESQKLAEPLFTPSTKAEQGSHDENVSPDQAAALIGQELYDLISKISIDLYTSASEYAASRNVILADTKFEFGLLPLTSTGTTIKDRLILIDEVLTPDSSRYWPAESYIQGRAPPSFDKQFVRDWLVGKGFKKGLEGGPPGSEELGWILDEDVVKGTQERYREAKKRLLG